MPVELSDDAAQVIRMETMTRISVGIDIGSTATKAILLAGGQIYGQVVMATGWDSKSAGKHAFDTLLDDCGLCAEDVHSVVGTGYGRVSLPFANRRVTEVTCHARGAEHMVPGSRLVVDIGGQDSKVIALDGTGNVTDFIMNDKCAAGTGRFLQMLAGVLDISLDGLEELTQGSEPVVLSSMCTVFAESEIVGLLARGIDKGAIAAGVIDSISKRLTGLVGRMPRVAEITFTGGLANNPAVCRRIEQSLGLPLRIPIYPQMAGALGAALIGSEL